MAPQTQLWKLVRQWLKPTPILKPPTPMIRRVAPKADGKMLEGMGKDEGGFVEGGALGGVMGVVRNAGIRIMGAPLMGMFLFVFWTHIPVSNHAP